MSPTGRTFASLGAASALVAVAAGAFGAHALSSRVSAARLGVWETAARYQMYHALALLAVAFLTRNGAGPWLRWSGWLFVTGTILFSGSLYVLVLADRAWLGAVTPAGGAAWLLGWGALLLGVRREA